MSADYVIREFYCRLCDQKHKIKLSKKIINPQSKFPISHIYLHGELKNLLTTLYIDRDFQIRGVDVHELRDDDIFSKDQVIELTNTLVREIESLRNENSKLIKEIHDLKKKVNEK